MAKFEILTIWGLSHFCADKCEIWYEGADLRGKFHVYQCHMSYLRGEKSILDHRINEISACCFIPEPLPTCCKSFKTAAELYSFYVILLIHIFINKDTNKRKNAIKSASRPSPLEEIISQRRIHPITKISKMSVNHRQI